MAKGTRGPYKPRRKPGNAGGGIKSDGNGAEFVVSGVEKPGAEGASNLAPDAVNPATVNAGFNDAVAGPQAPEANTEPSTGETIARRGRPRGSTNHSKVSASGIESLLLGIHNTLHVVFGAEELKLQQAEAAELANAYAAVAAEYPALNFDPKYAALANFAGVVSIVYGSRLAAFRMRMAMTRGQRRVSPIIPTTNTMTDAQSTIVQPPVNQFNGAEIPVQEEPRGPLPTELRTGIIPGVGEIVFDENHPLAKGKPN
jgi:hypothetical protein